jgi:hypothetical protein
MEATTADAPRRAARMKGSVNRLDPDGTLEAEAEIQEQAREIARAPIPHGRAVALGRDGKPIARRRDNTMDQFEVPANLKEPGWDYQWNVKSVLGEEKIAAQIRDAENGWRPVMADRDGFAGRFMPDGYKGAIEREGLVLCERPMQLTDEARREDRHNANAQRAENRRRFGLPSLPPGFEDRKDRIGQFGKGKVGVNVALEGAPRSDGKYQMAIDGDD